MKPRLRPEVGDHNPELQLRLLHDPIASWASKFLESDDRHPMPQMHLDITEAMRKYKRCAVKAMRSAAKSVWVSLRTPLYLACEHNTLKAMSKPPMFPHWDITICSDTGKLAHYWLDRIRKEIEENENILAVYGDLRGDTWNQDVLKFSNGVKIMAAGTGYQHRGWRPTLFIGDDLDKDDEVRSEIQMEQKIEWWDKTVTPMMDETYSQIFVIGTPLEEVCLVNYVSEKEGYHNLEFPAYIDGVEEPGYEQWPSKWPHERLQVMQREIGRRAFLSEYMCQNEPSQSPLFERSWWRYYTTANAQYQADLERGLYTVLACDPASSKSDGTDYNAIVTLRAIVHKGAVRIYVDFVKQGHWSTRSCGTRIFNKYDDLDAHAIVVESNAYQSGLADELETIAEAEGRAMRVIQVFADADKETRANRITSMVERGWVYVISDDGMHKILVNQCVQFQKGKKNMKKDCMDAFVHGMSHLKKWVKERLEAEDDDGPIKVLPKRSRPGAHTGVVQ